ncbi:DUF924 family protein [Pseudomonas quasicaspiana]|uniref:DUF924 family protein n=1 Tax=Pseudomonas quasicaspiana TaxID=2829821 RepID=UPI001E51C84C|nr:DUF924 family protein [Pseudomonas quasicaspiana]MCD5973959.1 DUF924 family protein [Pseudomonas quasicaspiana]
MTAPWLPLLEWFGSAGSPSEVAKPRAIIIRLGCFPHRNEILGIASTPEEIEF